MSARGKVWSIGLVILSIPTAWLLSDSSARELGLPVFLLGLAICGLVAEVSALRRLQAEPLAPLVPPGAVQADGVVDRLTMEGVDTALNTVNPCYRCFIRLKENPNQQSTGSILKAVNPALLGRVAWISVFVGRDGGRWTDQEITKAHEALERAALWLEREASRRLAPVNVSLADTYFRVEDEEDDAVEVSFAPEGDEVGPMEADASTKALASASRVAARLGFRDVADLLEQINRRIEVDARVWLFHVRRAGRSLALPAAESDVSGVGLAVCYAREASFPEPLAGTGRVDPTTVAHEVLHLFGASDKYGVPLRTFPVGSVSSREIMRLNHHSLYRMAIDPLTASEIGWSGSIGEPTRKKNARR